MATLTASPILNDSPLPEMSPKLPLYERIVRTPSPTPSEQLALEGKRRTKLADVFKKGNISKLFKSSLALWFESYILCQNG
jgi:hypothetical protein